MIRPTYLLFVVVVVVVAVVVVMVVVVVVVVVVVSQKSNPSDNAIKVDDKAHLASSCCLRHNACTSFCQTMSPHV